MEIEVNAETRENRLNNNVATTVVMRSVFMTLCKIKDDNVVQTMQQSRADAVDTWSAFQARKIKAHLADNALRQTNQLATASGQTYPAVHVEQLRLANERARYHDESKVIEAQAKVLGTTTTRSISTTTHST